MTRNVSGRPETDADARFWALRDSGYTGPIDQDGRPVADVDTWITERSGKPTPPPAS